MIIVVCVAGALLDDYCQATAAVKLDDFSQKVCLLQQSIFVSKKGLKWGDQFRFKPWNEHLWLIR